MPRIRVGYEQGMERYNARLTDEAVQEMRMLRKSGEKIAVLALKFGISPAMVSKICNRLKWKHVP